MASKASASSRNSSLRPSNWIRWESDPFAAMRVASVMRVRGGEHAAGEKPPSQETEHQQERQHRGCPRSESVQEVGTVGNEPACDDRAVGYVSQEEHPHGGEQQDAGEHEEAGVAE